jgi:hypothetical protein
MNIGRFATSVLSPLLPEKISKEVTAILKSMMAARDPLLAIQAKKRLTEL